MDSARRITPELLTRPEADLATAAGLAATRELPPIALRGPQRPSRARGPQAPYPAAHRRWLRVPLAQRIAQRAVYGALFAVGLLLAGRFAMFWFSAGRLPHDVGVWEVNVALFAALTFVVWHRQLMEVASWLICLRIEPPHVIAEPPAGLRVAFITTFVPGSEPIEMLARTLESIVAARYPHDSWVLDEGNDPACRALCARLGALHFSRHGRPELNTDGGRFAARTKGGNHNAWYAVHGARYDVVAQVDADFTVRADFLTRTLGHFRDPRVAFVGTPQIYGNTSSLVARGAAQQTYLFYGPLMRGLSRRRMTLLIGANHVVRVSALADIGWYNGHLTEDLATGKRFHARRWRSVYVPEPLAIGQGPATWTDYFKQQYRWAFGCLNIFFTHSPRLCRRMRPGHAFYYFLLEQFYFSGLRMFVAVVLLMLYFLLGWKPADLPIEQLALFYAPVLAFGQIMILALQRFNVRRREESGLLWAGRLVTIAAIPVYFLALVGVITNKRATFTTTPKDASSREARQQTVRAFRPHLILSALLAAGMLTGAELRHTALVYYFWGGATSLLMSSALIGDSCQRALDYLRGLLRIPATE